MHLFAGPSCHCRENFLPQKSAKQVWTDPSPIG